MIYGLELINFKFAGDRRVLIMNEERRLVDIFGWICVSCDRHFF